MSMAAPMELDAAPLATSDGPPVPDDVGEESDGPISAANELEMVCRTDGKPRLEVLRAPHAHAFMVTIQQLSVRADPRPALGG